MRSSYYNIELLYNKYSEYNHHLNCKASQQMQVRGVFLETIHHTHYFFFINIIIKYINDDNDDE
jgi:hypothetical protein